MGSANGCGPPGLPRCGVRVVTDSIEVHVHVYVYPDARKALGTHNIVKLLTVL